MSQESLVRARAFIAKHPWKFAKTYAKTAPHEYLVLDRIPKEDHAEFMWFVGQIWQFGRKERFWRTFVTYLRIDGKKYWTMDKTIEDTDLINRADIAEA